MDNQLIISIAADIQNHNGRAYIVGRIAMENFEDLKGKVLSNIENIDNKELVFTLNTGEKYKLYHSQNCCETVMIEDIEGDLTDLIGAPLLMMEVTTSNENPKDYSDSFTWTFYKMATIKGYVTIRWYGESSGYYSEEVDFGIAR